MASGSTIFASAVEFSEEPSWIDLDERTCKNILFRTLIAVIPEIFTDPVSEKAMSVHAVRYMYNYCLSNTRRCRRCGSLITRHLITNVKRPDPTRPDPTLEITPSWVASNCWNTTGTTDVALCAIQSLMVVQHAVDDCSVLTLLILM